MRETLEVRLLESDAQEVLGDGMGTLTSSGITRIVTLPIDDPAWSKVRAAELDARSRDSAFVTYWDIKRSYTASDLQNAELIQLIPNCMFEPAGEECGTTYDYSNACHVCGAGRVQSSNLRLDSRTIPARCDLAFTIARDEMVINDRMAQLIDQAGFTGADLRSVESMLKSNGAGVGWHQLMFSSKPVEVAAPTRFGLNPFDLTGYGRCPLGHVAGHNILSELSVRRDSWHGADLLRTRQVIGGRACLIAPWPLILVSQRCFASLRKGGFKGFVPEVVHLV
jgi:hypothetical protein